MAELTFLSGVWVLDLSHYIPGPFASLMLADLGADVIKIDRNADFFDPPVADMAGALFATNAILAALHGRHATGQGTHIDMALADAVMPLQLLHIAEYGANGTVPKSRSSYLNGGAAYYQVYTTAGARRMMLGPVEPKFWRNFCVAAGREDWIVRQDERMPQDDLIRDVAALFAGFTRDGAIARFAGVDCCLSPVLDLAEAMHAPQLAVRGLVMRHDGDLQALFPGKFDGRSCGSRISLMEGVR